MITSTRNPTVQHIRRLQSQSKFRREAGQFVLEGRRLVAEALAAGQRPLELLFTSGLELELSDLVGSRSDLRPTPVSEAVMRAASDTKTPQGFLAVLPIERRPLPKQPTLLLALDALRDPGNLGAILRTAAAAGVDGVLLAPGCADPFSPKVVRAAMGAHFRLPIHNQDWPEIATATKGLHLYLADSAGELPYTQADLRAPSALILGGEAHGTGPDARELPATRFYIPMPGRMESLNVAMAAGILIYEAIRQRAV